MGARSQRPSNRARQLPVPREWRRGAWCVGAWWVGIGAYVMLVFPMIGSLHDESGRVHYRTHLLGTKPVTVFDIRQTDGPPLPDPNIGRPTLLTGQAPAGLWDRMQGFLEDRGFEVRRGPCGDANGYTDFGRRLVMVRDDIDDAAAAKTLIHEGGHAILHQDRTVLDCRGILEVEAESVALPLGRGRARSGLKPVHVPLRRRLGAAGRRRPERPGRHPPHHRSTCHWRRQPDS